MNIELDFAADAREALRVGQPQRALELLQPQVRERPSDARLRTFLFQVLVILGQWDRALRQLALVAELDPSAQPMAQTYHAATLCEPLREQVFAGRKAPLLLGEPEAWTALLLEALLNEGEGDLANAGKLRAQALEQAPAVSGCVNGARFDWLADADSRIGPVLEAIVQGRYYWVPFTRIASIKLEAPEDLRDLVWMPAELQFTNGGDTVALVPTRYAGTPLDDGGLAMARRTEWTEVAPGCFAGQGQRMFASPLDDYPIMDLRELVFDAAGAGADA